MGRKTLVQQKMGHKIKKFENRWIRRLAALFPGSLQDFNLCKFAQICMI